MITLTLQAQQRLQVLHALDRGELRMAQAAQLIGLSIRHIRRLRRAYRLRGPAALVHGNRGRRSPHRLDDALRDRVVAFAQTTYAGANHLHLQELLAEREGLHVSYTSLRRILHDAGLPSPKRRRPRRHRRRRKRMPREGMLLQVDGSDHDWLEERGPRLTLVAAVDDATGAVLAGEFRDAEDAHGYLQLFKTVTLTHGLPLAVYSDKHGIFHRDKRTPLTLAEQLAGGPLPTQVGRALEELGIQWIPASSPQAKGRIENRFGTFQDRLVTELRVAGITDRTGANAFLPDFLARHNTRFARLAARARVEVHERLDGTVAIFYQGRRLSAQLLTPSQREPIPARPHRRVRSQAAESMRRTSSRAGIQTSSRSHKTQPGASGEVRATARAAAQASEARQPWKPPADHPWRRSAREAQRRKELRKAGVTFSLNR